jgi:hypothetical protein
MVPVTGLEGGYRLMPESLTALIRLANSANVWTFMTCGRSYSYETLLERLTQDLEDMAPALWPFTQAAHALVRPRHFLRHRHVAPADQPNIGDGVVGGTS